MAAADLTRGDLRALPEDELAAWLREQRWFASKSRDLGHVHVLETVPLPEAGGPPMVVACVELRFAAGTHDLYQLLLGLRPEGEPPSAASPSTTPSATRRPVRPSRGSFATGRAPTASPPPSRSTGPTRCVGRPAAATCG